MLTCDPLWLARSPENTPQRLCSNLSLTCVTPVDLTCNVNYMSFIKTLFPLSLATSLAKIQACNT